VTALRDFGVKITERPKRILEAFRREGKSPIDSSL
jgi:hypothetical protein